MVNFFLIDREPAVMSYHILLIADQFCMRWAEISMHLNPDNAICTVVLYVLTTFYVSILPNACFVFHFQYTTHTILLISTSGKTTTTSHHLNLI